MEFLKVTRLDEDRLQVQLTPDTLKLIKINGKKARRLADLGLHHVDLNFALECLQEINGKPTSIVTEALWRSAITHFIKCFVGGSARSQLDRDAVYKNEDRKALICFDHFKLLRDKHFIHDENSCSQCMPGAAINAGNKSHKIEKIIYVYSQVHTLRQEDYISLHRLISIALKYATSKIDDLCIKLTEELEKKSYEDLINSEDLNLTKHSVKELHLRRKGIE